MKKAVKAIFLKEKKILLLKRCPIYTRKKHDLSLEKYKFLDKANIWDLPGGKLEEKELEKDGLKREVREEIGIEITILKKYSSWSFIDLNNKKVKVVNYLCRFKDKKEKIKLSEEHSSFKWVSLDKIKNYNVKDDSFFTSLKNLEKE
jgi:8-oxo-dGTP diphosphatase